MENNLDLNKNTELTEALKEFELNNSNEPALKQETESNQIEEAPKMIAFVIKYSNGIIKTRKSAEYFLLFLSILVILLSIFLIFTQIIPNKPKSIPKYREDIDPKVRARLPKGVYETIPSKYENKNE